MHRPAALALELMEPQASVTEVTPQPADPGLVRRIAAGDEQVATAARDVRGIEHRFEFIGYVADGFPGFRNTVACIEQLVGQLWPWRSSPARAIGKILLEQRSVGIAFKVARTPAGRRFDNLVADDQVKVPRAGKAKSPR